MRSLWLVALAVSCSPHATVPPARQHGRPPDRVRSAAPPATPPAVDEALLLRELAQLPSLTPVSGKGWSATVAGRDVNTSADGVDALERLSFEFEESTRTECQVFEAPIDAAAYFGRLLEDTKKAAHIIGVYPSAVRVEQEIPIYFANIRYRKQSELAGLPRQLKIALGMHPSRPVICLHDAPGYSDTFEKVIRSLLAHYRVDGEQRLPLATTISMARVGALPVGFAHESIREREDGCSVFLSTSADIVPRSATEVMVSDEAEVVVVKGSKIVEGRFSQGDVRGKRIDLNLKLIGRSEYRISGVFGTKPLDAKFEVKGGLASPDAVQSHLRRELVKGKPFRFTESEYHASLDPSGTVSVDYSRAAEDPADAVHVRIGQLEVLVTLDESGNQLRSEMRLGSQSLIVERLYQRDQRPELPDEPKP